MCHRRTERKKKFCKEQRGATNNKKTPKKKWPSMSMTMIMWLYCDGYCGYANCEQVHSCICPVHTWQTFCWQDSVWEKERAHSGYQCHNDVDDDVHIHNSNNDSTPKWNLISISKIIVARSGRCNAPCAHTTSHRPWPISFTQRKTLLM